MQTSQIKTLKQIFCRLNIYAEGVFFHALGIYFKY